MREAYAVTGYISDHLAQGIAIQGVTGTVDLKVERGVDQVLMRVAHTDITEVRTGASARGETLVQLILRDNAKVETVINVPVSAQTSP